MLADLERGFTSSTSFAPRASQALDRKSHSDGTVVNHRRTTMVTSIFSTSAPPTWNKLARPAEAARLNFIDFNPSVPATGPGVLTPVVVMHGLLGNSRNFQGWGSKLVKVRCQGSTYDILKICFISLDTCVLGHVRRVMRVRLAFQVECK